VLREWRCRVVNIPGACTWNSPTLRVSEEFTVVARPV